MQHEAALSAAQLVYSEPLNTNTNSAHISRRTAATQTPTTKATSRKAQTQFERRQEGCVLESTRSEIPSPQSLISQPPDIDAPSEPEAARAPKQFKRAEKRDRHWKLYPSCETIHANFVRGTEEEEEYRRAVAQRVKRECHPRR
ncbi:hypothetical protein AURDEDRAFT_156630 [Auricularia subglabra TFB-10046 SS5]|nr:hypothetical protein AURDEDRAFT_156630 [Auricularia subglabra TFB-10046 SS5]